tara:strand:+ start:486 stop:839 length:354 start_codon:yes stop_codon:yes gene_type:complete
MKKVLYFLNTGSQGSGLSNVLAFPSDRLIGIYRSADTTLDFHFDDMQNTATASGKASLAIHGDYDNETAVKDYMEKLAEEIAHGKSPVIVIFDESKASGFNSIFSGVTSLVTHGATS